MLSSISHEASWITLPNSNRLEILCFLIWFSQIIALNLATWSDLPATAWISDKRTRLPELSDSILINAAPEISANWILWWTQHDCCATNKVICLFKAPSMTKKVINNTGIELFHWLNSMIIGHLLEKPPPSFTMPPMLQAVKTTRKQLYQVLFFPFASTDKEMLSWLGPWFAKAVIFCRANLSHRPFLKAFKALSFLAPFAYTSIKLVTTVNKLVWYPI